MDVPSRVLRRNTRTHLFRSADRQGRNVRPFRGMDCESSGTFARRTSRETCENLFQKPFSRDRRRSCVVVRPLKNRLQSRRFSHLRRARNVGRKRKNALLFEKCRVFHNFPRRPVTCRVRRILPRIQGSVARRRRRAPRKTLHRQRNILSARHEGWKDYRKLETDVQKRPGRHFPGNPPGIFGGFGRTRKRGPKVRGFLRIAGIRDLGGLADSKFSDTKNARIGRFFFPSFGIPEFGTRRSAGATSSVRTRWANPCSVRLRSRSGSA